jgi:hypothetical protein
LLATAGGRAYVQIVAQLHGRFAAWRVESDATTSRHLAAILDRLEAIPDGPPAVRRARVLALIVVLTGTVAERARRIDEGSRHELDHEAFVTDLTTVGAAIVAA